MPALGGLDHCIILVRDLDRAERQMARLGFRPTPRGHHSDHMGTANATVMFGDGTYFETLGVVADRPANAHTREHLATVGEGLHGLALKSDDAAAAARALGPLADGEPVDFVRPVDLPEGRRDARFTIVRTIQNSLPGVYLFVCQQHTPEVVWRPDHLDHPNGALGVVELVGVADDPAAMAAPIERIGGTAIVATPDAVTARLGSARLGFLTPTAFGRRYAVPPVQTRGGQPGLLALRIAVGDPKAAGDLLRANGATVARSAAGTLCVPPEGCCGAWLELTAPD
jgi:hypothetical protein